MRTPALRTLVRIGLPSWPPMHPASRRCSSVTCARHASSSRLAIRAPRRPRVGNLILTRVLSLPRQAVVRFDAGRRFTRIKRAFDIPAPCHFPAGSALDS